MPSAASSAGASIAAAKKAPIDSYNNLLGQGSHGQQDAQLHYKLDESGAGGTAADSSGNSFDASNAAGTGTGSTTGGAKWHPLARDYDGTTSEFTNKSNEAAFNFDGSAAFSFGGWVLVDVGGSCFSHMDGAAGFIGYDVFMNSSNGTIDVNLINTISTNQINVQAPASSFTVGTWIHVFVTYDGSKNASGVTLYLDGVEASLTTQVDNLTGTLATTADFMIGGRDNGASSTVNMNGRLNDVVVADVEYTAAEVLELFKGPEPTNTTAPTLSSLGVVTSGTWDARSNGTLSRLTTLHLANGGGLLASSTSINPDFSAFIEPGVSYYVIERGINDGDYDSAEDTQSATMTAGSVGRSIGQATAAGVASVGEAVGNAAGTSTALAVSAGPSSVANAAGTSTAAAVGDSYLSAIMHAAGTSEALGVAKPSPVGVGNSAGSSVAQARSSDGTSSVYAFRRRSSHPISL